MEPDINAAHDYSSYHREQVVGSDLCGCFFCCETFLASEITRWTDEGQTALCPRCGIDSVIGSESGYPITPSFLTAMNSHWF